MVAYLIDDKQADGALVDLSVFGSAVSLGVISCMHKNYFGMYTAVMYTFNHFVFKKKNYEDVPKEVLYNLGMCFYTYFAFHSLKDAHVSIY